MNLNKRGWGMTEMIFISSVLLGLLLFMTFQIKRLYGNMETADIKQYASMESKLELAAVRYDVSLATVSNYRVSVKELKSLDYISSFTDNNGRDCDGYVDVNGEDFNAYISCQNYITKGYSK